MNEVRRVFRKGEFITYTNKPGSFAIFEGIELDSNTTIKKYSVIVFYDPKKYCEDPNGCGWVTMPFLEVATSKTRCTQTAEGSESSWWRVCTEEEKEKALDTLQEYGYYWNEDLESIISKDTGEILRKITEPVLEYNGEVVKPISSEMKTLLKKVCNEITEKKYSYQNTSYYCYGDFWNGDYWD
jgi:hypothetical protein